MEKAGFNIGMENLRKIVRQKHQPFLTDAL